MHRVRANEPAERRLERLASPSTEDNRISYGCINVPVDFYEAVLKPAFDGSQGAVYVLPEVKPLEEVFTSVPAPTVTHSPALPRHSVSKSSVHFVGFASLTSVLSPVPPSRSRMIQKLNQV